MNTPAPEPKPKRSRRMIVWLVAAPIVILLLALAGANWKTFHLAYARHLIASDDPEKRVKGIGMIVTTHLRVRMSVEEVNKVLRPAEINFAHTSVLEMYPGTSIPTGPYFGYGVMLKRDGQVIHYNCMLYFNARHKFLFGDSEAQYVVPGLPTPTTPTP